MKLFVTYNNHNRPEDMPFPDNWDNEGGYDLIIAKDINHASELCGESVKHIFEVDMLNEAVISVPFVSSDSPRGD